jgi:hypothetical protein
MFRIVMCAVTLSLLGPSSAAMAKGAKLQRAKRVRPAKTKKQGGQRSKTQRVRARKLSSLLKARQLQSKASKDQSSLRMKPLASFKNKVASEKAKKLASMTSALIREHFASPPMQLVPATKGVSFKTLRQAKYQPAQETAAFEVQGKLPGGRIDLIALLPVTGDKARNDLHLDQLAKGSYKVRVAHPDRTGDVVTVSSTGLVTQTGLSVALKPGVTRIQFWHERSTGVSALPYAREIELHYNPGE